MSQPVVAKDRVINSFPKVYDIGVTPFKSLDFDPIVRSSCQRDRTNISVKLCKAVVVGDVAVGKTSLVNRFCHNIFDKDYKATIGVDFEVEKFSVLALPFTLQLWDTAGQERFRCIAASYYRGANTIIVAFDLSDINTLTAAKTWYEEAVKAADEPIVFLVGLKRDLVDPGSYDEVEVEALKLAQHMNAEYWPTSSKTGANVKEFFFRLVALTFNRMVLIEKSDRNSQQQKSIGSNPITMKSRRDNKDVYERKKRFC